MNPFADFGSKGDVLGGIMGAAAAGLSPNALIYKWQQRNNLLYGSPADRVQKFNPVLNKLLGRTSGEGVMSTPAEMWERMSGALARISKVGKKARESINLRAIARGHGPGSGMAEAGHLLNDQNTLDQQRQLMGQAMSDENSRRIDRMAQAERDAAGLAQFDTRMQADLDKYQFGTEQMRNLQGSRAYRAGVGFITGYQGLPNPVYEQSFSSGNPWGNRYNVNTNYTA